MLAFCLDMIREAPNRYYNFGVFTLCEAYIVGWLTNEYKAEFVVTSLFMVEELKNK